MITTATQATNDRYQILALSGGGYRGLFTAAFLSNCEMTFKSTCADKFDLIAGTSIGALLAAGVAVGLPALTLKNAMMKHGPVIFKPKRFGFLKRLAIGAPYDTRILYSAIKDTLGAEVANTPLSRIDAPLMISAVNYTHGTTEIFRSRGLVGAKASDITLAEAVLASAAAPTFFPLVKAGTDQFADGGLVANAPDMAAILETIAAQRAPLETLYTLSVGTAGRRHGAALHKAPLNPSIVSWFFYRGLIQTTMAAQEDLALRQAAALLGTHHLRVDEEPTEAQVPAISSLDRADQRATDTLLSLADAAFSRTKTDRKLRSFF
tara:strand:+ start:385 stop:1350 length:966 start_codon:yes stop_codon:yes gene_type:complete